MADSKISALSALLGVDVQSTDLLAIVDVSGTTTKKITVGELLIGLNVPAQVPAWTYTTGSYTETGAFITNNPSISSTTQITLNDTLIGGFSTLTNLQPGSLLIFTQAGLSSVFTLTAVEDATSGGNAFTRLIIAFATGYSPTADAWGGEYTFSTIVFKSTAASIGLGNVTNDAQIKVADLDTDSTFAANSDSKVPSQKAVKSALDLKGDATLYDNLDADNLTSGTIPSGRFNDPGTLGAILAGASITPFTGSGTYISLTFSNGICTSAS